MEHPQQQYRDAAQALLNKGINFVGIDFDVSLRVPFEISKS
jgi:hypothetical protein